MSNDEKILFRVDGDKKEEFKKRVPNMTEALRQVLYGYVEDADKSLEDRIIATRKSILRMHKTRLESEIDDLQDHLDEINEILDEVEEEPQVLLKIDLSTMYERNTESLDWEEQHKPEGYEGGPDND